MRPVTFYIVIVAGIFVALLGNLFLKAEAVEHHGFDVDSMGKYNDCLSCHDGMLAQKVSPCVGKLCFLQDSHPVYRPYPPPNRQLDYAPTAQAEQAGILLVDGMIDCISCHNLMNADRYHLRVEDRDSRLCRACHLY